MIIEVLIDQLNQRFQHEKRAQVCLWFDEKREFERLLPALHKQVESMKNPPFVLLEYNPGAFRGQIWLKYRIHKDLEGLTSKERARRRYVLYLPPSEDRVNFPDKSRKDTFFPNFLVTFAR